MLMQQRLTPKMNQLSELATFSQNTGIEKAETEYNIGLVKFNQAKGSGFENKQVLLSAYRHFVTANRAYKKPEYLCALAHILLLIQNFDKASDYVQQALKLDPEFAHAHSLQNDIQKMQSMKALDWRQLKWTNFEKQARPQTQQEMDAMYDSIEDFLESEIAFLMHEAANSALSFEIEDVDVQENYYQIVSHFLEMVGSKIQWVAREYDVQDFEQQLHPIRQLRNRFMDLLERYARFQFVADGINGAIADSDEMSLVLRAGKALPPDAMDELLDLCDLLADELDNLSEGGDIIELENHYNVLVGKIESLQDMMDE